VFTGILLSFIAFGISFVLPEFAQFKTNVVVVCLFAPISTALSESFINLFIAENRRFLVFSIIAMKAIFNVFIETFAYNFGLGSDSNYPTTLSVVITHVILAVWITVLNSGRTLLGANNLEQFPVKNFFAMDQILNA